MTSESASFLRPARVLCLVLGGMLLLVGVLIAVSTVLQASAVQVPPNEEIRTIRPPYALLGLLAGGMSLTGSLGLGAFFLRRRPLGKTLALVFGGLLSMNLFWLPALLIGKQAWGALPIIAIIGCGIWLLNALLHPLSGKTLLAE